MGNNDEHHRWLEENKALLFDQFMKHSEALGWVTDREGKLIFLNKSGFRFFEQQRQAGEGFLSEFPSSAVRQALLQPGREVLDHRKPVTHLRAVGQKHFLVTQFPAGNQPDATQPVDFVGGMAIDITDKYCAQQAVEQLEKKWREEERARTAAQEEWQLRLEDDIRSQIGQELHDNVNQLLCSARMHLDVLDVKGRSNIRLKKKTSDFLLEAVEEIRRLSRGMVVRQLKQGTLVENIEMLADDILPLKGIEVSFHHQNFQEPGLPEEVKFTLYRILQEQLRNIVRHSRARNIVIRLDSGDGGLELIIEDDGIGFDPGLQEKGIGLVNIRHRVNQHNGHFTLITAPGKGCVMCVILPLTAVPPMDQDASRA